MDELSILTFNSYQTYCYGLSRIGGRIFIVHKIPGKEIKRWDINIRPCPDNIIPVSMPQALEMYEKGRIDLAVCHNISDLMEVSDWQIKKILCIHETVRGRIMTERSGIGHRDWNKMVRAYLQNIKDVHLVFVSEKKAKDWDLNGTIIELGVDPCDYYGYSGRTPNALTVSNGFKLRGKILGFNIHRQILESRPYELVGLDPAIPTSRPAANWGDLKEKYRQNRVYVYTALEEYEDGYNTAMLEAMATGMPVVSYLNNSSPITNGINGFISDDIQYLRECLDGLLNDQNKAIQLGKAARRTVIEKFGIDQHVRKWRNLLNNII